eukprot:1706186-Alexandrium_andersonii.AAC.1
MRLFQASRSCIHLLNICWKRIHPLRSLSEGATAPPGPPKSPSGAMALVALLFFWGGGPGGAVAPPRRGSARGC